MFETATFDSMGTIHTRSRNWMFATFGLNTSILALLIAIPLFHPSMLPPMTLPQLVCCIVPPPVEETPPVVRQQVSAAASTDMFQNRVVAPRQIPVGVWISPKMEPQQISDPMGLSGPTAGPGTSCDPFNCGHGSKPVVQRAAQAKPNISRGVMEGMLIYRVLPTYSPMALAMRASGRVELQATISRGGTIENLRVASGPPVLQQSAIDAVKQWRYRPYLLNGEPVEVETTIYVDFKLD